MNPRNLFLPGLVGAAFFVGACVNTATQTKPPVSQVPTATPKPTPSSYWKGEGVQGAARIVVNLEQQKAYFYKGETLVGETRCSTGKKSFETPRGTYKVIQRHKDHYSNLYGTIHGPGGEVVRKDADTSKHKVPEGGSFKGAKMPYYLRFHGGYGLHAGRVPNYPASHGCVRLPRHMAEHFYNNSIMGTPVIVETSIVK